MVKIRVKMTAYAGAQNDQFIKGRDRFSTLIDPKKVEFVDHDPDVIFFLTGGSEQSALQAVEKGRFYVIVSSAEANSNAAAFEVKARLNANGIDSVLLDADEESTKVYLKNLFDVLNALRALEGQQLGLIGEVSDWLVASEIDAEILKSKLGIILKKTSWEHLPDFSEMPIPKDFMLEFSTGDQNEIEKAGQLYLLLKHWIEKENLDAVTVECFSLVSSKSVTGCLALAMLNKNDFPAACEGDIASGTGMMTAYTLTGTVPWMANAAKISKEKSLFAHCTISPNLVSSYEIKTHFETSIGTAIQGSFIEDDITLFRFDDTLSHIFITRGIIINRPQYNTACRTQVEVKLEPEAVDCLREKPLGNHHLILPGDHVDKILLACRLLNIKPIA